MFVYWVVAVLQLVSGWDRRRFSGRPAAAGVELGLVRCGMALQGIEKPSGVSSAGFVDAEGVGNDFVQQGSTSSVGGCSSLDSV